MNFSPRIIAALTLACVVLTAARGEETGGRFLVRSWQSEDGLPSNVVRSVAQAADGYLWVATAEGVVRFDGVRFAGFATEREAALARGTARALFAQKDGDVWVATTRGGLLRWHAGQLAEVWKDLTVTPAPSVSQVVADGRGGVLIVRAPELWRAAGEAAPVLAERTPEIEELLRRDAEAAPVRARQGVRAQLRDRRGRVWTAGAAGRLTVTDSAGASAPVALATVEPGNRVNELCEDREGSIWAATADSGLVQIRERRAEVLTVADGLADRTAFALLQDRAGAWWVGSKRGGLDRISGGAVTHFEVGDGSGNRPISALGEDRTGRLWAATRDGSVFRQEGAAFAPAFPVTMTSKVVAIMEDARGRLWFGGLQGLAMFAEEKMTHCGAEIGFTSASVSALATDAVGTLWVGTHDGRIFRGDEKGFAPLGAVPALGGRPVLALLLETDGSLWAATLGGGLFHWHAGKFTRFSTDEGLPDARLTSVLDDGAGHLWLGSLGGIFRVAKTDLRAIEERRQTAAVWLQLDRSDGLLTRECTGGFQPAAWRAADGELRFPTVNGVVRIRPEKIATNAVPPPVLIEEVRANDRVAGGGAVETGPGRSRLEFSYTGLSFAAPERVRFRTLMEGLESDWREVGTRRVTAYEAVPPGRYRFRVQAANNDGVWSPMGAAIAVTVRPHIWETLWFRVLATVLAAAVAAGAGWGIARGRMRRRLARIELQSARETERARIARDLHDDLGASLTEISMLAAIATEGHAPAETLREPLQQIAGKAHTLVGALDEIVWAVNPRHDTLASLADYLAAFAAEFLASTGLALRLDVARDLPPLALDAERRHGLFLAVREALNNAVKHSGAREIWLRLRLDADCLLITIEDHGRGFDPAKKTGGDGLRNLRERLASLGGDGRIDSIDGAGTRVHLRLPLPPP